MLGISTNSGRRLSQIRVQVQGKKQGVLHSGWCLSGADIWAQPDKKAPIKLDSTTERTLALHTANPGSILSTYMFPMPSRSDHRARKVWQKKKEFL